MNGVRRFLGGGGVATAPPQPTPTATPPSTITPLAVPPKPSWPPSGTNSVTSSPQSNARTLEDSPKPTAALFLRKDRQRPAPQPSSSAGRSDNEDSSSRGSFDTSPGRTTATSTQPSSPVAGPSSPRMAKPGRVAELARKPVNGDSAAAAFNSRDELLISLLASEAVVDSRGCEILSSEEVEELKKESQVLSSRLVALTKKLKLETKIRDAAVSLSKANSSYKNVSKQSSEQVENASRKVDAAQKDLWRVSERAAEINRRLLEHRAGVLSYSLRSLEKKAAPPELNGSGDASGYNTPNRLSAMSPTQSSVASGISNTSRSRFDGAHFFAGHSDTIVPAVPRLPPSSADLSALEQQLQETKDALDMATVEHEALKMELESVRAERDQLEATMGIQLDSAQDDVSTLQQQMSEMKEERDTWIEERAELEQRRKDVDRLERRLEVLEEQSGETAELRTLLARARQEKEKEIADMQARMNAMQEGGASKAELEESADALHQLMQTYNMPLYSRDTSLRGLVVSVQRHIEGMYKKAEEYSQAEQAWNASKAELEKDIRNGLDKREALAQDLEEARSQRDAARSDVRSMEDRMRNMQASDGPVVQYTGDAAQITATLQPLWAILPSPEARATKLGGKRSATPSPISPGGPRNGQSLSEMDVRSLKTLYDPKGMSIHTGVSPEPFSMDAFVARIHALVADDRALIERLVRFAQAHDLLKKNAERAQKLAQESSVALETYQKQVKTLEERHVSMAAKQAALQDEVAILQEAVERITEEKRELETQAAAQAETCKDLTEANATLSARILNLAEVQGGSSSANDAAQQQLQAQLAEVQASLAKAQEEIDMMRMSQQTQQMALLEELNTVQTENTSLRAQLRGKK